MLEIILYVLAGIAIAILLIVLKVRQRYNAAMNVLMARYTFARLTRDQQKQVKEEAKQIVLGRDLKIEGYENDVERYGWYALAMKALEIPSKLPENPNWFKIRNPSKAVKRGDMFLNTASNLIKQNYNIDVSVN